MFAGYTGISSGLGLSRNCRWIKMGENWWQWVCFNENTGQPVAQMTMSGAIVPCQQRQSINPNKRITVNTALDGAASNMPYVPALPYCEDVTFIDEAVYWVKENPLFAAAGAFAALKLFKVI